MTPEQRAKLHAVMNTPGFGTGRAYRDRLAQEAEALATLPDPRDVMPVRASTDAGAGWLVCSFGNSGEDGQDWHLITDEVRGSMVAEFSAYPADAKTDALITAAIVNAYRMGLLIRVEGPPRPDPLGKALNSGDGSYRP
jgi:hypothetical protein